MQKKTARIFQITLQKKIFLGFFTLNSFIFALSGFLFYKIADRVYMDSFLRHKASLADTIAGSIDSEKFASFHNEETLKDSEFQRYTEFFRQIQEREKHVVWVYSIWKNSKDGTLRYALDATKVDEDSVWIENVYLGLRTFIKDDKLFVHWDNRNRDTSFNVDSTRGRISIDIIQKEYPEILIQDKLFFRVKQKSPLLVELQDGRIFGKENSHITVEKELLGAKEIFTLSFAPKGGLASTPGLPVYESDEFKTRINNSIENCQSRHAKKIEYSAYGWAASFISPIKTSNGKCNGVVIISVAPDDINEFEKTLGYVTVTLAISSFIVNLLASLILSRIFTNPLEKLRAAVERLSKGDMDARAEILSHDELGLIAARFNSMVAILKKANKETETLTAMREELKIARKIQESILPSKIPEFPGLKIHVSFIPMTQVAGDYYDFHSFDPNKLGIIIADVTGHGIPAAITASMLKVAFSQQRGEWRNPKKLLQGINRVMIDSNSINLLTAIYAVVDIKRNQITMSRAGHPPLMYYSTNAKQVLEANPKGRVIGATNDFDCQQMEIKYTKGDRFLFYTDGIVEAMNAEKEYFGEERLKSFLAENIKLSGEIFSRLLIQTVVEWKDIAKEKLDDDITLIVLDIV